MSPITHCRLLRHLLERNGVQYDLMSRLLSFYDSISKSNNERTRFCSLLCNNNNHYRNNTICDDGDDKDAIGGEDDDDYYENNMLSNVVIISITSFLKPETKYPKLRYK